jgi:hypothetical protein
MNTVTFFETEEDAKKGNALAESSIVQYVWNRKENILGYKRNAHGSTIFIEEAEAVRIHHEEFCTHIVVIGGRNHEEA